MDLYKELSALTGTDKAFISLIGGGGKTTLMVNYADYLRSIGKRVLVTTTTKIMSPHLHDYKADLIYSGDEVLAFYPKAPCVVLYALVNPDTRKWSSPSFERLEVLMDRYDVVINEADGSKNLPIKVHTPRDPQVPFFTTYTISIMGLWAFGRMTSEVAFGETRDIKVDENYLNQHIRDPEGLLKGSLEGRRTIVFNGADRVGDLSFLRGLDFPSDVHVLAASEMEGRLYEKIR